MLLSYEDFRVRADAISNDIATACVAARRDPKSVQLLAVTKLQPAAAADYAARYGLRSVGENRVQEAVGKRPLTSSANLQWELIGHLQSNKARLAAQHFDRENAAHFAADQCGPRSGKIWCGTRRRTAFDGIGFVKKTPSRRRLHDHCSALRRSVRRRAHLHHVAGTPRSSRNRNGPPFF